jgi:predicted DNA repair protein MutK
VQLDGVTDRREPLVSVGLLALLDDIAALAKVAAASLDDIAGQAAKAGAKAAGVVIDDAAVTPRYVIGFSAARELPIVRRIAAGSLRNKLLILLPVALLLGQFLPWAITPLLMLGGAYLCYEGVEKLYHALAPHQAQAHEAELDSVAFNPQTLEDEKVASAIKTDFILSAEIMAISLAAIPPGNLLSQAAILAVVAVGITVAVYGAVALIVKADDAGVALARRGGASAWARLGRVLGRALVRGMPIFLMLLSAVGTAAMIWVGGGIIVHGLETYGFHAIGAAIHAVADLAGDALPPLAAATEWLIAAAGAGLVGLAIGTALIPLVGFALAPGWRLLRRAVLRPRPTT